MDWVDKFDFFLFDLDGLLVNTEVIHFQAYVKMMKNRGFDLNWTFLKYSKVAHFNDTALKETIYEQFPSLYKMEPNWNILRDEKNRFYIELLTSSKLYLMEGVIELLTYLEKKHKRRCVVTNSSKSMVELIKSKAEILSSITNWIVREDYLKPKPNPESYLLAINKFSKVGDKIIGFEDSLRGLQALICTNALSLLISKELDPRADNFLSKNVSHFESLKKISL